MELCPCIPRLALRSINMPPCPSRQACNPPVEMYRPRARRQGVTFNRKSEDPMEQSSTILFRLEGQEIILVQRAAEQRCSSSRVDRLDPAR